MSNSDETVKKTPENEPVLQAIAELAKTVGELSNNFTSLSNKFDKLENRFDKLEDRFGKLESFVTVQFEAVRKELSITAQDMTVWRRNFSMFVPMFPICEPTSKN